jgi:putative flavoprotein involved in K+ transport
MLIMAANAVPSPSQLVTRWLDTLAHALSRQDIDGALELFHDESYWRDLVAFTWNITTQESRSAIGEMLRAQLPAIQPSHFSIEGEAAAVDGVIEGWFGFETAVGRGRGHVRLREGRAWTLLTTLIELKGFEEHKGERRLKGVEHGIQRNRQTWLQRRQQEEASLGYGDNQPYVLVIGGGQGGIVLGARLRQLGVPTIIIEKNARAGDSWRNRYQSLCLHDPVWYDHLPYMPFPEHWPIFSPKDKIGDWLEMYTKVMELNYWTSSIAKQARFDEATKTWEVTGVASDAIGVRARRLRLSRRARNPRRRELQRRATSLEPPSGR